jgi:hypothetical protein
VSLSLGRGGGGLLITPFLEPFLWINAWIEIEKENASANGMMIFERQIGRFGEREKRKLQFC